ncbi:CLUMA_CG007208, isoform A [Clunio marinus]|uniref:CLUMA_CG007208, isoform A n=1 Tax=Clunio marinus TaxID=568069 RepID=A0A1J1I000_9DIPT|nr:CLUMA_CG007208, isoform A [Clunio marinus]
MSITQDQQQLEKVSDNEKDQKSTEQNASESQTPIVEPPKSILDANGFKIIKSIGSGSYSKVKLAFSENHKASVAIKIVPKYNVPEEFLRKFLYSEITVVKFLKHENIIKYYQSIETSHRLYVVMQFAENGSILELIQREKRISESRACDFFRQIMNGVEYCHNQKVCHRDLKCENILLDERMVIKIIDFGFAKCYKDIPKSSGQEKLESALPSVSKANESIATKKSSGIKKKALDPMLSETYCGSFAYASPELLKSTPYDPFMSDIWAMGCVLYAMVFGRLPFDDKYPGRLIRQVQQPVQFPTSVHASDECKSCIKKILAPLKRRCSIGNLREDLWIQTAYTTEKTRSLPRSLTSRNSAS